MAALAPLKTVEPFVIRVDNATGIVETVAALKSAPARYDASDGSETLAPKDGRGELVVVHATAREFRLRKSGDVFCVFNEAYDPVGVNSGSNTTSPSIERLPKAPTKRR